MARINIETSLWSDYRFQNFMIILGDRHKAIGMVVDLWLNAQRYWIPEKLLIPEEQFKNLGLSDKLIECGLAERRPEGVYTRGIKEHFNWWFERQEAGRLGGVKSGEKRRLKQNEAKQSKLKQTKQNEPSSSSSSYSDFDPAHDSADTKIEKRERKKPPTAACLPLFDFESLYQEYPLKRGKAKGLKICQDKIKTTEDYDALRKCIKRYREDCAKTGAYIMHFSTFMNGEWEDWRDPETGTSLEVSPSSHIDWSKFT